MYTCKYMNQCSIQFSICGLLGTGNGHCMTQHVSVYSKDDYNYELIVHVHLYTCMPPMYIVHTTCNCTYQCTLYIVCTVSMYYIHVLTVPTNVHVYIPTENIETCKQYSLFYSLPVIV